MSTPQRCLAQAEEAERLAAVVAYERDRTRLMRQAAEWRAEAAELEAAEAPDAAPDAPRSWFRRCSEALLGSRRTRER